MANIYFDVLQDFKIKWERRYPGRYFYPRPHHYKQLKELITPVEGFPPLPIGEIKARITIYLNNKYFEGCKHNFSKFIEHFDMFVPPAPKVENNIVVCGKCNAAYRTGQRHQCSMEGGGHRRDLEAQPLTNILDQVKPASVRN